MITFLLGCLLAFAQAAEQPSNRIAGLVVNSVTGQPVRGARVTVASREQPGEKLSLFTGPDGRFAFTGIPRGKYELSAERRGLLQGCGVHAGAASTVVAGTGQQTDSIELHLCPPAAIFGTVADDGGDRVEHTRAQLFASAIVNGRRRLTSFAMKQTNDAGDFRFGSLPAGTYYLAVSGSPWYAKVAETLGEAAPRTMTHAGYATEYYSNASNPAGATPIVLKPGQEVAANFVLLPSAAAAVHVHVEGQEEASKQFTLTAAGPEGTHIIVSQGAGGGDVYNFWAVPPGHFTLHVDASDAGHAWYAEQDFDVSESDVDVSTTLLEAPSLTGTLELEGGGKLPEKLSAVLVDAETGEQHPLAPGEGRFSVPAISPHIFQIALNSEGDYYLKQWSAEGARREGDALDLRHSSAVRMKLLIGRDAGRVQGTVSRENQPVAGALVALVSAAPANSSANRIVFSASDGSYEFRGVAPGSYAVFSVPDATEFEYASPAAIQPYLKEAQKIQVASGEAVTANLR